MKLIAIILTLNEEQHLSRCLASLKGVVDSTVVVDSFSTDKTIEIAKSYGAHVEQHSFINYANQFNWALTKLKKNTDWVLRIDADEYLTPTLIIEIQDQLDSLPPEVNGVFCGRSMIFQGKKIRFGGVFPNQVLRIFRYGQGKCENRWMDEHIKVKGATVDFKGEMIDDNLNSLSWWTDKHNSYASREAVDLLNLEFSFIPRDSIASLTYASNAGTKRWIKEKIYARLPNGLRAFAYFFYRYVLRLGFLDGQVGTAFHFLQGFWYRYLVDAKVAEVKRHMRTTGSSAPVAIDRVLGIKVFSLDVGDKANKEEDDHP